MGFFNRKPKIVTQTVALLKEQIDEARPNNPLWKDKFGSEYALGYIMSFSTVLIKSKTHDDDVTSDGVLEVFESLFGSKDGIRVMQTANQYKNTKDFEMGLEDARNDLIEFIDKSGERPNRLHSFLTGNR